MVQDVRQATFRQMVIPQAVYYETTVQASQVRKLCCKQLLDCWLQVRPVSTIAIAIPPELDDGEQEAIALALETGEQQILLDEREVCQVAQRFGLQVIGTQGILLLAQMLHQDRCCRGGI